MCNKCEENDHGLFDFLKEMPATYKLDHECFCGAPVPDQDPNGICYICFAETRGEALETTENEQILNNKKETTIREFLKNPRTNRIVLKDYDLLVLKPDASYDYKLKPRGDIIFQHHKYIEHTGMLSVRDDKIFGFSGVVAVPPQVKEAVENLGYRFVIIG